MQESGFSLLDFAKGFNSMGGDPMGQLMQMMMKRNAAPSAAQAQPAPSSLSRMPQFWQNWYNTHGKFGGVPPSTGGLLD